MCGGVGIILGPGETKLLAFAYGSEGTWGKLLGSPYGENGVGVSADGGRLPCGS